jgi:hypothetical protein
MWMSYNHCIAEHIKKLPLIKKDLSQYSLETVKMFYNDAQSAKFVI